MADKQVVLQVIRRTKDTDPKTKKKTGTAKQNTYTVLLADLDDYIIDFFNIPTYTQASNATTSPIPFYSRKGGKRMTFSSPEDATGTEVVFDEGEGLRPVSARAKYKVAVLTMEGRLIRQGGKKLRTCSIRFPGTFTNLMVAQALGTMIAKNRPNFFKIYGRGRYPLVNLVGKTELLPGAKEGAWALSSGGSVTDQPDDNQQREDTNVVVQATLI